MNATAKTPVLAGEFLYGWNAAMRFVHGPDTEVCGLGFPLAMDSALIAGPVRCGMVPRFAVCQRERGHAGAHAGRYE